MSKHELQPCPFCGSSASPYPDGDMEGYTIMCNGDKSIIKNGMTIACPMHTFGFSTHELSVLAWNTRTPEIPMAHLQKILAWLRSEAGQDPQEAEKTLEEISGKLELPVEELRQRMPASPSRIPKYIRHSLRQLEKTILPCNS